jgi:hypothetical protein
VRVTARKNTERSAIRRRLADSGRLIVTTLAGEKHDLASAFQLRPGGVNRPLPAVLGGFTPSSKFARPDREAQACTLRRAAASKFARLGYTGESEPLSSTAGPEVHQRRTASLL